MTNSQFNIPGEIWKEVPDYPGYEVSDQGRVRSYWKRQGHLLFMSIEPQKILKQIKSSCNKKADQKQSYRFKVTLCNENKKRKFDVARLVLSVFVCPCPQGMECCHWNDRPDDNRLQNLRWGTKVSNRQDRSRNSHNNNGEHNGKSKLTEAEVKEIRHIYQPSLSNRHNISEYYGISVSHINAIIRGKYWSHLLSDDSS
jgi:hypothetical protein